MATVRDILSFKGTHVFSIGVRATILDAAQIMNHHKIGSLVVLDQDQVVGILTERDVLRRVVVERLDPGETFVEDVMTTDLLCCTMDTTLDEIGNTMRERKIRHLPVIDTDRMVCGLVSIGDLNAHHTNVQEQTIHHLSEYLYGRV